MDRVAGSPFIEVTLPETAVRLKQQLGQQLGRLIHIDKDNGTATILDHRLVTCWDGLMRGLPSFEVIVEPTRRRAATGTRGFDGRDRWMLDVPQPEQGARNRQYNGSAPTNGQARPIAVAQGSAFTVPTLLGRVAPRIRVAGRIRAGIKALARRAAENERVRAIYDPGVGQSKSLTPSRARSLMLRRT